jgi:FkbM family methyltransferase
VASSPERPWYSPGMRWKRAIDHNVPFVARVYRRARDWKYYHSMESYQTSFGFHLVGDPGLDESRIGSFEVACFQSALAEADVLIDIGANVGLFSCLAAQCGVPVLAIEPHADNVDLLERNIAFNGLSGVEVLSMGVSNVRGEAKLYGAGQGASLVQGWGAIQGHYSRVVTVDTLDSVLADRFEGKRLLIKMDAEGSEHAILLGAHLTLAREPAPTWIVENGLTQNFEGMNPHFKDVFGAFWDYGYEGEAVSNPPLAATPEKVEQWLLGNCPAGRNHKFSVLTKQFTRVVGHGGASLHSASIGNRRWNHAGLGRVAVEADSPCPRSGL